MHDALAQCLALCAQTRAALISWGFWDFFIFIATVIFIFKLYYGCIVDFLKRLNVVHLPQSPQTFLRLWFSAPQTVHCFWGGAILCRSKTVSTENTSKTVSTENTWHSAKFTGLIRPFCSFTGLIRPFSYFYGSNSAFLWFYGSNSAFSQETFPRHTFLRV